MTLLASFQSKWPVYRWPKKQDEFHPREFLGARGPYLATTTHALLSMLMHFNATSSPFALELSSFGVAAHTSPDTPEPMRPSTVYTSRISRAVVLVATGRTRPTAVLPEKQPAPTAVGIVLRVPASGPQRRALISTSALAVAARLETPWLLPRRWRARGRRPVLRTRLAPARTSTTPGGERSRKGAHLFTNRVSVQARDDGRRPGTVERHPLLSFFACNQAIPSFISSRRHRRPAAAGRSVRQRGAR